MNLDPCDKPTGFFKKGETLAITITLNPRNFPQFSPDAQCADSLNIIYSYFKHIGDLTLYPELTKQGMIHYHGWLVLMDPIKYFKTLRTIVDRIGFIDLKRPLGALQDETKKVKYKTWNEYITKDCIMMAELLNTNLPFTSNAFWKKKKDKKKKKTHTNWSDFEKLLAGYEEEDTEDNILDPYGPLPKPSNNSI